MNVYQINVKGHQAEAYGYNVLNDYSNDGILKPDAKPKIIDLDSLSDIRGWYCTDREGFKRGKAYSGSMIKWISEHCQ